MGWDGDNKNADGMKKHTFDTGKCEIDPTAGADKNEYKYCNLDLPFGFQDIDPMLITVLGEVVGNILSGNMPTNVANAFGNWLQLIAQVIVMFNAQQQYSQGGPGRFYSPEYRNISNPFTIDPAASDGGDNQVKKRHKKKKHKERSGNYDERYINTTINELNDKILALEKQIEELRNKM